MNKFFIVMMIAIGAVGFVITRLDGPDPQGNATERGGWFSGSPASAGPLPAATPWPTSTPVPPPTVDFMSTAQVAEGLAAQAQEDAWRAQSTADAAMRLQVEATAAQEQRTHEERMAQAQQSQIALQLELLALQGTQTAGPTAVVATQTQQAFNNQQVRISNTMVSALITATAQAPALIRSAKAAEYYQYTLFTQMVANVGVGLLGVGLVLVVCIKWVARNRLGKQIEEQEIEAWEAEQAKRWGKQPEADAPIPGIGIMFKNGEKTWRDVMPCTRPMVLELADRLVTGTSLAINNWEGAETTWTREMIRPMRDFLRRNGLAVYKNETRPTRDGELRLTGEGEGMEGEKFMRYVSINGDTPPLWVFGKVHNANPGEYAHMSLSHDGMSGGGGYETDEEEGIEDEEYSFE